MADDGSWERLMKVLVDALGQAPPQGGVTRTPLEVRGWGDPRLVRSGKGDGVASAVGWSPGEGGASLVAHWYAVADPEGRRRRVEFAELPRTGSGAIRRAAVQGGGGAAYREGGHR
ncbi:hypothetical protein ACO0M4_06965 [Streptomyces sp. RGM 3693]|uniref:hypothetical protein n=1 Tax=Streptomyces sp. RGM 3693 TaxID=3413284 RepID=UPI003D2DB5A4